MSKFNSRKPSYDNDSDYTTNAPSYYDDLARKNHLIKELAKRIWEYDKKLNESLENIEKVLQEYITIVNGKLELIDNLIGEGFNDRIEILLREWVNDGTLEHIINTEIFNTKVDIDVFNDSMNKVNQRLSQTLTVFNVKNYGASGDGVDDDTEPFKNAIKDIEQQGYGTLFIPKGEYRITEQLKINSNVDLIGEGSNSTKILGDNIETVLIRIEGSIKNNTLLSQTITKHSDTFNVSDSSGIDVNDVVRIRDGLGTWEIDPNRNYRRGQLSRVTFIEGNSIKLDHLAETDYNLNCDVTSYNTINVVVRGLTIKRHFEEGSGITIFYGENVVIEDIIIENVFNEGIVLSHCVGGIVDNCQVNGHGYSSQTGYGVAINNSIDVTVRNSSFYNGRRGVDISGSSAPSRYIKVVGCTASRQSSSGFGAHAMAQHCLFDNNIVSGYTSRYGLDPRGKDITISNNIITAREIGIAVTKIAGTHTIINNVIDGKIGNYWLWSGIRLLSNDNDIDRLVIKNNVIDCEGQNGIIELGNNNSNVVVDIINITNNTLRSRVSVGKGIVMNNTSPLKINKMVIENNEYSHPNMTKHVNLSGNPNIEKLIIFGGDEGTDTIIESGSNSLGDYVKYSDGTQMCWSLVTVDLTVKESQFFKFPKDFNKTINRTIGASFNLSIAPQSPNDDTALFNAYVMARGDRDGWYFKCDGSGLTSEMNRLVLTAIGRWE